MKEKTANKSRSKKIDKPEDKAHEDMIQSVVITFAGGEKAVFTGKAVVFAGGEKIVQDIHFTIPKQMPPDCSWGAV